jgi:hypothetical protein|nr:MAG TPA: hypothetical protein [Caudoviricetes sp.]
MKILTPIQSISDIITNSSSETFLMYESFAKEFDDLPNTNGCVDIYPVTEETLLSMYWDINLIERHLGLEETDPYAMDTDTYKEYVTEFILPRMSELEGLYVVDIEDHFSDACEVLEDARDCALARESRH